MSTKNSTDVHKILDELRKALKLRSFVDLAEFLGVRYHTMMKWKTRNKIGDIGVILEKCPWVNPHWLRTGEGSLLKPGHGTPVRGICRQPYDLKDEPEPNIAPGPPIAGRVPLISWVQAGNWEPVADPYQPGDAEEWVLTTRRVGPHAFALRVVGDSMEPEFREGETIIVDPDREAVSGSYVIAKIDGGPDGNGEATFKRLIRDGGRTYLKPVNNAYPIMDMTGREFRIVGVVVEKRKEYV